MKTENTNRLWGVFDETGIFAAFCRHGFTLTLTDMVRSGEQYISDTLNFGTNSDN